MKDNIFYDVLEEFLSSLPERSRFIVIDRFGIHDDEAKTLDAIGKKNNITRERVRQLVNASINQINESRSEKYNKVQDILTKYVDSRGGIVYHDRFLRHMHENHSVKRGICNFYVYASEHIDLIQNNNRKPFAFAVFKKDFDFDKWNEIHEFVEELLKRNETVLSFEKIVKEINNRIDNLNKEHLREYLYVSRTIKNNPFDEWGFNTWNEINLRGVKDKVYLVLRYRDEAMHFRDIAKAIDKYGLNISDKATHPQTVHNELIKDDRFVLTGRGTYKLYTQE